MLRITVREEVNSVAIVLEGRLAGDWVAELRSVWTGLQFVIHQKPLILTLTEMSSLDPRGPGTARRDSRKRRRVERLRPDGARRNRKDNWETCIAKKETSNEKQEQLYCGGGSGGSCTACAIPAHILSVTLAEA